MRDRADSELSPLTLAVCLATVVGALLLAPEIDAVTPGSSRVPIAGVDRTDASGVLGRASGWGADEEAPQVLGRTVDRSGEGRMSDDAPARMAVAGAPARGDRAAVAPAVVVPAPPATPRPTGARGASGCASCDDADAEGPVGAAATPVRSTPTVLAPVDDADVSETETAPSGPGADDERPRGSRREEAAGPGDRERRGRGADRREGRTAQVGSDRDDDRDRDARQRHERDRRDDERDDRDDDGRDDDGRDDDGRDDDD